MIETIVGRDPLSFFFLLPVGLIGFYLFVTSFLYWKETPRWRSVRTVVASSLMLGSALYGILVGQGWMIALAWWGFMLLMPVFFGIQTVIEMWQRRGPQIRWMMIGAGFLIAPMIGLVGGWIIGAIPTGKVSLVGGGLLGFAVLFGFGLVFGGIDAWEKYHDWRGWVFGGVGAAICVALITAVLLDFSMGSILLLLASFGLFSVGGGLGMLRTSAKETYWRHPNWEIMLFGTTQAEGLFGWEAERKLRRGQAILMIAAASIATIGLVACAVMSFIGAW